MDEQNKINNEEKIKELEKKLEEAEKLKNDYLEGWQRERAEFLNFQKEIEKRNEEIIKRSNEDIIRDLLTVLDSFDISINSLNVEGLTPTEKNIMRGIELIREQMLNVLEQRGLKEIKSVGEKFNPIYHEALEIVKGEEDDKIAEEIIKGYELNGKVIRPAKVKVMKKQ
ncbi:MAG TPA: nucleotide exchange factor GrpE [Candidatus Paceibacterota bacterium]|jgi:molecular chaperone GrpE|nr:nucleotide exchange factor GrpE [Candidatus Paceibacterota bacterium]